ncbi:MAG: sugar phosphate isomerase/epimerase family protein [Planctomycetota bacterium]
MISEQQLGVSTLTWKSWPITDSIRRAHELGFTLVDLGLIKRMGTGIDPLMLIEDLDACLAPVEAALADTGIGVASFNARLHGDATTWRDQAEALARAARRLGVISGITLGNGPVDAGLHTVVEDLRMPCAVLQEHGITPMVESHRNQFTEDIGRTAALLEALPDLQLTLDASHYISQGLQPDDWEVLLPRVRHAHLRPCDAEQLCVPVTAEGPGTAAWLRRCADRGYTGTITHERMGPDPEENESETIAHRAALRAAGCLHPFG